MGPMRLSRRDYLRLAAAGFCGLSQSGWLENLAATAATDPKRKRACILLWMAGGPSQTDTFDMKPGHPNGGPFKEIATSAPGLRWSEHLPKLAKFGDRCAVIRSMSTKEGDHGRATYLMRTGYLPQGQIQYPTLGSLLSKELGSDDAPLPNFVSIAPFRQFSPLAYNSGFLGPQHAPLLIADNAAGFGQPMPAAYEQALKVRDVAPAEGVTRPEQDARIGLLQDLERDFASQRPGVTPHSHQLAYQRAVKLMRTDAARAFELDEEKASVRDAYGRNLFGQGCLLARRLVERGVPFVEVTLNGIQGSPAGWDTHADNFTQVRNLCNVLDPAWAALMGDLKDRGLLDDTLVVWMGEFGRTPVIEGSNGRNHYPVAWSTVLAGGGVKGGQAVGSTGKDGVKVEERPVSVGDFLATVCGALGIDGTKTNLSNVGRPIRIVDKSASPVEEVIAS